MNKKPKNYDSVDYVFKCNKRVYDALTKAPPEEDFKLEDLLRGVSSGIVEFIDGLSSFSEIETDELLQETIDLMNSYNNFVIKRRSINND